MTSFGRDDYLLTDIIYNFLMAHHEVVEEVEKQILNFGTGWR